MDYLAVKPEFPIVKIVCCNHDSMLPLHGKPLQYKQHSQIATLEKYFNILCYKFIYLLEEKEIKPQPICDKKFYKQ